MKDEFYAHSREGKPPEDWHRARKKVLVAYQERKQEEITHPFLDEKVMIGMLFHIQALLMARFLREDLDGYPPFIWK